jgi:8-oxo-dGTP diphosphatase
VTLEQIKQTVLVFLIDTVENKILLIEKKRGMGKGLWNAPGGKVQQNEKSIQAVERECCEEVGLVPLNPEKMGTISFLFSEAKGDSPVFNNRCEIFRAFDWTGTHQPETEECRSFWWPIDQINYDLFWPDDRFWLPQLLEGKSFERVYHFNENNEIVREEVIV